jgi:hypothetical protein
VGVVLVVAACGGGSLNASEQLAAVCDTERVALGRIAEPAGLEDAATTIRVALDSETTIVDALRAAGGPAALIAEIEAAQTTGRLALAAIEEADPQESMLPLRTAVSDARRTLAAARRLVAEACRLAPSP